MDNNYHPGFYKPEQEWEYFKSVIKHKIRYCLFDNNINLKSNMNLKGYVSSHTIPDYIIDTISRLKLLVDIPNNTKFFRSRVHNKCEKINNSKELGSPPFEKTGSQRLSPHGISYFYCSNDKETAVLEVRKQINEYNDCKNVCITTAEWINNKNLKIIDLSIDLDEKIKLLAEDDYIKHYIHPGVDFTKLFIEEIKRPTYRFEKKNVLDYLLTQFISEYLRLFIFKYDLSENSEIDGICYPSTQKPGGESYCLFFSNDFCSDKDEQDKILRLSPASINTENIYINNN